MEIILYHKSHNLNILGPLTFKMTEKSREMQTMRFKLVIEIEEGRICVLCNTNVTLKLKEDFIIQL